MFRDLTQFIDALDRAGELVRIKAGKTAAGVGG